MHWGNPWGKPHNTFFTLFLQCIFSRLADLASFQSLVWGMNSIAMTLMMKCLEVLNERVKNSSCVKNKKHAL
jgi:hypothetical protein